MNYFKRLNTKYYNAQFTTKIKNLSVIKKTFFQIFAKM